jgi:hypothetical protein
MWWHPRPGSRAAGSCEISVITRAFVPVDVRGCPYVRFAFSDGGRLWRALDQTASSEVWL